VILYFVDKDYRGQGIAKKFIVEVENYLKQKKVPMMGLHVQTDNENAKEVYRECGMHPGTVVQFYEIVF
jgi:ribosomal protein S18 acetylase RimI-like enzyme